MVKLPEGRICHVPEDLEKAIEEVSNIDTGPRTMGERVRKEYFYLSALEKEVTY